MKKILVVTEPGFPASGLQSAPCDEISGQARYPVYINRHRGQRNFPEFDDDMPVVSGADFRKQDQRHGMNTNKISISPVCRSENTGIRALTAKNLIQDFGHGSSIGKLLMSALADDLEYRLKDRGDNSTEKAFREWYCLFGQVENLSPAGIKNIQHRVSLKIDIDPASEISGILFVIHTYYTLVVKLLAAQIISKHESATNSGFCEYLSEQEDNSLLNQVNRNIEQGEFFANAGIGEFIEGTIFSWYAGEYSTAPDNSGITDGIRKLLARMALYHIDNSRMADSPDVLKPFYQSLIPEITRKALGEFYTPDWLVDITCECAAIQDWLLPAILDPACGSGSFLLTIIKQKRSAAKSAKLSPEKTLHLILNSVQGLDLNPLAVQAARVNFLIAVIDLVPASGTQIKIPVLLADAIHSPANIIGKFDVVIGNPPWIRWSNLSVEYRKKIKPICDRYEIFSNSPYHGGNELDISAIMTCTVADKWLEHGGTMVFVITQTLFQSPSSQGFRNFRINDDTNLVPMEVDDLKDLKPFPGVSNKTAILRLKKVKKAIKPNYPVAYRVWNRIPHGQASLPETLTPAEISAGVNVSHWQANPVNGGNSPWAILPPGRFNNMAALRGQSNWLAGRKGITTDMNGIYMVRIVDIDKSAGLVLIETRPEAGRTDIGIARRFWVEPDLLYPLLKGAGDFSACHLHLKDQLFVFVPNHGIVKSACDDAEVTMSGLRQTLKFFHSYKYLLEKRSTYRLRQKGAPFYAIYNVGSYTFAPYKVVWAEQSNSFEAAVISSHDVPLVGCRVFIPDHKIYFTGFHDRNVACFVCGLLNSQLVREYISCHTIKIQVSNIFRHLALPEFSASNNAHMVLSEICASAHAEIDPIKKTELLSRVSDLAEEILLA